MAITEESIRSWRIAENFENCKKCIVNAVCFRLCTDVLESLDIHELINKHKKYNDTDYMIKSMYKLIINSKYGSYGKYNKKKKYVYEYKSMR